MKSFSEKKQYLTFSVEKLLAKKDDKSEKSLNPSPISSCSHYSNSNSQNAFQIILPKSKEKFLESKYSKSERSSTNNSKFCNTSINAIPPWVYCTRYSERPSAGPRAKRCKKGDQIEKKDEKRPRTAFTSDQLNRLKLEFEESRYISEPKRKRLADDLGLCESQIKIWFQNKRAKKKKELGNNSNLAAMLHLYGLYNHRNYSSANY